MTGMSARERYLAVMRFEPGVRTLLWEYGYWNSTVERWYGEGLRRSCFAQPPGMPSGDVLHGEGVPWPPRPGRCAYRDIDIHHLLQLDEGVVRIPVNWRSFPPFEEVTLEEDDATRTLINRDGVKVRVRKNSDSLPQHLDWPVHDRRSWERVKDEHFRMEVRSRLPPRWESLACTYRTRDYPLGVILYGFFGIPRELLGVTRQLMMYYDDPALMHDINGHLLGLFLAMLEELLAAVELDYVYVWEDLAFKNGPLISPQLFAEFMVPYYSSLCSFLRARNVDVICVDTDGDFQALIPGFVQGGITGFFPFEVQAGVDVVEVRKQYPSLQIQGGLDKIKLAAGPSAIDAELSAKLPYMLQRGGYVPFCDHLVPPDVSWDNFCYYRQRVKEYAERYRSG